MACKNIANKPFKIFSRNGNRLVKIGGSIARMSSHATDNPCSSKERKDMTTKTHTGQVWAEDDYRNVRFTNAKRYVNEHWSANMRPHFPVIFTSERVASCDGGGILGHPKVYICMDKPIPHYCFYCGQEFRNPSHKISH